jgi:hypothetical protein
VRHRLLQSELPVFGLTFIPVEQNSKVLSFLRPTGNERLASGCADYSVDAMKNPFASPKKTGRPEQDSSESNVAGIDHLEYGGQLPNSTSYDSALEAMANSGSNDRKDPYAPQHISTSLEIPGSRRVSRTNTRNAPDGLDPDGSVDAVPADDDDKPEDTNLFRMMIADMKALVRIYKAMSWKDCFKTLTQRYLWSESDVLDSMMGLHADTSSISGSQSGMPC